MQVGKTGRDCRTSEPAVGSCRWIWALLISAFAVVLHAGEERDSAATPREDAQPAPASKEARSPAGAATKEADRNRGESAGSGKRLEPAQRVAVTDKSQMPRVSLKPPTVAPAHEETPIERAIRTIADCQARYHSVEDYTCTFYKRERIGDRLGPTHVMLMKVRTSPHSVYLKFKQPAQGREAIYIAGRNGGKLLAHDVGLNKLLAGTLQLEPTSARAMEECRHPITEAGIGSLLDTLAKRWAVELNPDESKIQFTSDMLVGKERCSMIESIHPQRRPHFMYYKVRVFIDDELGLPIRFEAYEWPKRPQLDPELAEEYTYTELKLNVGLKEIDFDVANSAYSFGRF
jgi:Protein of unknown function (DUF1571)